MTAVGKFSEVVASVQIELREPLPDDSPVVVGGEFRLFEPRASLVHVYAISADRTLLTVGPPKAREVAA